MKYFKRTQMYKASNVTFNIETGDAFSYGWWRFVAVVDGVVFFNNHSYSPSTGRHQYKIRRLLDQLSIKIDVTAPFERGIPKGVSLADLYLLAEENLCDQFIHDEERRIRRNERAAARRLKRKQTETALVTHAAHESQTKQLTILKLIQGGN